MDVYCVYTAVIYAKNCKLTRKKAKTYDFLLEFVIACPQRRACVTNVYLEVYSNSLL
jgi:hypothetical protein